MTYAAIARGVEAGLMDRVSALFTALRERRERFKMYRRTVSELAVLSDRELLDLGLHRSMIETIALEAAYGK
ncbi:MAG: DUF1127 domain-containing protein [Rhodobacteraceae bacterium]|nr:DUF1127 domain-containing protein [Paracoccaceae bacterium]